MLCKALGVKKLRGIVECRVSTGPLEVGLADQGALVGEIVMVAAFVLENLLWCLQLARVAKRVALVPSWGGFPNASPLVSFSPLSLLLLSLPPPACLYPQSPLYICDARRGNIQVPVDEGNLRTGVAWKAQNGGGVFAALATNARQAVVDMQQEIVEVDLGRVFEVDDWDQVLLREVPQQGHLLEQGILNLIDVFLQEGKAPLFLLVL